VTFALDVTDDGLDIGAASHLPLDDAEDVTTQGAENDAVCWPTAEVPSAIVEYGKALDSAGVSL